MTHDKEKGNVVLAEDEVPFILASRSKLRISGHEHITKILVVVNQSIIKQGEELFFFVEQEEIVKPPPVAQGLQLKAGKRAKVASS